MGYINLRAEAIVLKACNISETEIEEELRFREIPVQELRYFGKAKEIPHPRLSNYTSGQLKGILSEMRGETEVLDLEK